MSSGLTLLPTAAAAGLEVVVLSFDQDDRRVPDTARPHIDRLVAVDTNDECAVIDIVRTLDRERRLSAVIPGFEYYVPLAARAAARINRAGLPPDAVDCVRDKAKMLARLSGTGLRIPRHAVVRGEDEVGRAGDEVGFPCVLKPGASSGSVHVRRADSIEELWAAHRRLMTDPTHDLGRSLATMPVVVCEYLTGPELSVEGFVADGRVAIVSVTSKLLGPEPYFVELGHIVQADLNTETRTRVEHYTTEVVRALGITMGPFHCELRLVNGEPVLIEIGARLGGDHIPELVELVEGVSLTGVMLAGYTGLPFVAPPPAAPRRAKYAGIRYLTAPVGLPRYHRIRGLADLSEAVGTVRVGLDIQPGEPIAPPEDSRCRVGYVIFTADSYQESLETWQRIGEAVHID